MIDLVTDFEKIININTQKTIEVLKNTFNNVNIEKNKPFIKSVTKYYTAIAIWNNNLSNIWGADRKKLMDNILLDYCSLLNCIVLGDEKLINFLYRNIIESILRVITNELKNKEIDSLFKIEKIGYKNIEEKKMIESYSSLIKSIYINSCKYVHVDINKIPKKITNLLQYNTNSDTINNSKMLKDFEDLNIAILSILRIKYSNIYYNFKPNSKSFIEEIIPLKERIKIRDIKQTQYK
ncbi:Uncharacterised protein [uncultured Clostridium sp.]|uniref:hypothetical protein n=1 Tax=uncultured Clostridium sp. TaxID=59620 RepID=UPI0008211E1A|nr:hypothetical protein [uncultured Clostridium sp.]SCK04726.1 Uncharacterised protein [uncultured Clostridium sp.]